MGSPSCRLLSFVFNNCRVGQIGRMEVRRSRNFPSLGCRLEIWTLVFWVARDENTQVGLVVSSLIALGFVVDERSLCGIVCQVRCRLQGWSSRMVVRLQAEWIAKMGGTAGTSSREFAAPNRTARNAVSETVGRVNVGANKSKASSQDGGVEDWRTDVRVSGQVQIEPCRIGAKIEGSKRALVDSTSEEVKTKGQSRGPERWGR